MPHSNTLPSSLNLGWNDVSARSRISPLDRREQAWSLLVVPPESLTETGQADTEAVRGTHSFSGPAARDSARDDPARGGGGLELEPPPRPTIDVCRGQELLLQCPGAVSEPAPNHLLLRVCGIRLTPLRNKRRRGTPPALQSAWTRDKHAHLPQSQRTGEVYTTSLAASLTAARHGARVLSS